ncbi:hypothetical protein CSA56_08030 [candidate division KSB3 bacterium]|uniref:Uncharacterized protein n=1 Tax=candidate division KSB3 bacterium TaxID=2044937 RepID=A0A2G6KH42_9BACT|nr:MAG: hypothetical protein CSA56_08030 [candidate division KSB3 bacterium]
MAFARCYPGAVMVCIGGGSIGLAVAEVVLISGAKKVFVSDLSEVCRSIANTYEGIHRSIPH